MINRLISTALSGAERVFHFCYYQSWRLGLWTPADRRFLTEKIFAFFSADMSVEKILFVGTHAYTKSYERFFARQTFVTIDRDPCMSKFGARQHKTLDVTTMNESGYDVVMLNGVIGHGLDSVLHISLAVERLRRALKPGGWLVVGTNRDGFSRDVDALFSRFFKRVSFPPTSQEMHRFSFPLTSQVHEYRFFRFQDHFSGALNDIATAKT